MLISKMTVAIQNYCYAESNIWDTLHSIHYTVVISEILGALAPPPPPPPLAHGLASEVWLYIPILSLQNLPFVKKINPGICHLCVGVPIHWTGLLDSKFNHKISFHCSHNYQNLSSKAVSLPGSWSNFSLGHLDINFVYSAIRCNREVACVTFSVAKHWRGGLIYRSMYSCIG